MTRDANNRPLVRLALLLLTIMVGEIWAAGPLVINEFMASNSTFLRDRQGQYDDWVEIGNAGDVALDVGGMYLTDDADDLTCWQVPEDVPALTTIPAGGYMVVWADRDAGDLELHASFRLSATGGELHLVDVDGVTILDSVEYGRQRTDISYGRYPDLEGAWRFLGVGTPGTANVPAYEGFVANPQFSHERGFYDSPFALTLTCETPGAVIYYTTDGTEPYMMGGRLPTGTVYKGPVQISGKVCIRAKAIKAGWKPSEIVTNTYIFLSHVPYQSNSPSAFPSSWGGTSADYGMDPDIVGDNRRILEDGLKSLPTMSLVIDIDDLFDSKSGIYSNWNNQGEAWERPASIELIHPDGTEGFQSNCGVRIYGGVGRREKKKSFRLLFKGIYGPTKLQYPLFGEGAVDEFDTIILRANFNDGYPFGKESSQYIRDEYCRRLQLALGHASPHGIFVHLYVNGLYWGLYNPVERPDASFAASYYGGDKEDWDAYNSGSPTGESSSRSWNGLLNAARSGVQTNEGYQRLQGNNPDGTPNPDYTDYLDIEPYIDFMIANFFVGNTDWPGHNWYGAMNAADPTGFKFFMWDAEWVLWITVGHGLDSDLYENRTGVSNSMCEPYARLRNNPEFRVLFGDRVHRAFFNGGPLSVEPVSAQWDPAHPERNRPAAAYAELADLIERAMIAESARWGDVHGGSPRTIEHWRAERDRILGMYMVQRPGIVLSQLRNAALYPQISAPVFEVDGSYQHGGHIASEDRIVMSGAGGTVWYTLDGTDPRVSATASAPGGQDTVLVSEAASKKVLIPSGPVSDAWRGGQAFDDSAWLSSAGSPGGIGYERSAGYRGYISTDVVQQMYGSQTTCYIRIPFMLTETVEAADQLILKVRYDDGFIAYLNGAEVARRNISGEPAWNSAAQGQNSDIDAVNFESIPIVGNIDKLRLRSNILAIHGLNVGTTSSDFLISVELVVSEAASGIPSGMSPTVARYSGPILLDRSLRVKARALSGSVWSAVNEAVFAVGPVAESLRVSEIMYHPADIDDPNSEFIELTNVGAESVNLNLVRFTAGINYTFDSYELPTAGYCLLVRDADAFEMRYGPGLPVVGQYGGSLSNGGERIELVDAAGKVVQSFEFDDRWSTLTDGMGFSLTVRDPQADAGRLDDKAAWRASTQLGGSPGADD